jgi:hypothetical protein
LNKVLTAVAAHDGDDDDDAHLFWSQIIVEVGAG